MKLIRLEPAAQSTLTRALDIALESASCPTLRAEIAGLRAMIETQQQADPRLARLSRRESETLTCMLEGDTAKIIAYRLGISTDVANHHRANVYAKLGVRSLADVTRIALLGGWDYPVPTMPTSRE